MINTGITYYKLDSTYEGDITKNCGLTGGEIDTNFFNLRGNDIDTIDITKDGKCIVFSRLNGEKIVVEGINTQTIDIDKTFYDRVDGVLVLSIDGVEYRIDGFFHESVTHKVYSGYDLDGDGTQENPLNVREVVKSGFFKSVERFIDMTNGEGLPVNPHVGSRYLTKENVSDCGLLYNFEAVKELDAILKDECSSWRIPTNQDWAEMLNALELCEEDMTHGVSLSNANCGKIAGAYLKGDTFRWVKKYVKTEKEEGDNIIIPFNNILPEASLDKYLETVVNGKVYEIINDGNYEYYTCESTWDTYEGGNITPISALSINYGFAALPVGCADYLDNGYIRGYGKTTGFWTISQDSESDVWVRILQYNKDTVRQQGDAIDGFYSLRLVKDYTVSVSNVEIINEIPYGTVLMPYVKLGENGQVVERGSRIWTKENITYPAFLQNYRNEKVKALKVLDRDGNEVVSGFKYFVNYWNGKSWEKREFGNNDIVIISNGPRNLIDEEWQLVNGELCNKKSEIEEKLTNLINAEISTLTNKLNDEVKTINEEQVKLDNKIDEEITNVKNTITDLTSDFNKEVSDRISKDESTDNEITSLKETDANLRTDLNSEIKRSVDIDEALRNDLTNEISERSRTVNELTQNLESEVVERRDAVESLVKNLEAEVLSRQDDIAKVNSALKKETNERKANDIKFPETGLRIDIVRGATITTEGDASQGIDAKVMGITIDTDFGQFE